MQREELLKVASDTFDKCLRVMDQKNHDYTGGSVDALKNFKVVEFYSLTSAPTGVLVRMCDKFMRLCSLVNTEARVADESIEDTADDLINYLIIFKATLRDSK